MNTDPAEFEKIRQQLAGLDLAREVLGEETYHQKRTGLLARLGELDAAVPAEASNGAEETAPTVRNVNGDLVMGQGQKHVTNVQGGSYIERADHVDIHPTSDEKQIVAVEALKARRRYLEKLSRHCQALPLAALGGEESADDEITLERVYIELDTTTLREGPEARKRATPINHQKDNNKENPPEAGFRVVGEDQEMVPLSALEAASQERRLVLLGEPGSGKSTFARRLLAWLCSEQLDDKAPPPGFPGKLTPVLILLRDLAARLEELQLEGLPAEDKTHCLLIAIRTQLTVDLERLDAEEFKPGLLKAFSDGECLLVLDGLDETPFQLQTCLRSAIQAIQSKCNPQRILVTCRIRSYSGATVLPDFRAHTLAPFDGPKIKQFATAWYLAQHKLGRVDALEAQKKSQDLAEAAQGSDLFELAQNPMLLTSMAIIHQKEIGLPRERVRLYSLIVDVLLRRWQARKAGDQGISPALTSFLRDDLRLRSAMERLAYEAHRVASSEKKAADLPRGDALTLLDAPEYLGSITLANEFLTYVDQRAGLLIGRGGEIGRPDQYSFPHRTFQEYLAGCYLVNHRDAVRCIAVHATEGDTWRLALVLGAEDLLFSRRQLNGLLDLTYRLCPLQGTDEETNLRLAVWAGELASVAGPAMIQRDTAPDGGSVYLNRLGERLVGVLAGKISAPERAAAGRSLGRLGDPRLEVLTCAQMQFCYVPAGLFWMGVEKECHQVELAAYWISRFPITQAQFAEFVLAGGYHEQRYWVEAIREKHWNKQGYRGYDGAPRQAPDTNGDPFDLPNHPVVGISWYEALAFTNWLSEQLQRQVRLPSEAEWEKAARGGLMVPAETLVRSARQSFEAPAQAMQSNPAPQQVYPWGDRVNPKQANYDETGIGATSAVGCFPGGASPYGCQELSGNVWEWTRSQYAKYPYQLQDVREELPGGNPRVLRGGSFLNGSGGVRCTYRGRNSPDLFSGNFGFRVCLPHSPQA